MQMFVLDKTHPGGIVIVAAVNAPGSMYDSTVAELGGIYDLIFQN